MRKTLLLLKIDGLLSKITKKSKPKQEEIQGVIATMPIGEIK
jgi:hypothetical protein